MDIFNINNLELLLDVLPAFCGFIIYRINNKIDLDAPIGILKFILLFVLSILITGIEYYVISLGDNFYNFFLEHVIWFKRYVIFFLGFSVFYILVFFNFFVKIKDYLKKRERNKKLNFKIIRILKLLYKTCSKKRIYYIWLMLGIIFIFPFYNSLIKEILFKQNSFAITFSGKNINLIKLWFDTGLSACIIRNVVTHVYPLLIHK